MKEKFNWRDYDDYSKWLNDVLTTLTEDNEVLQSKIDKAIEWVYNIQQDKDNKHLEPYIATDELDEILEILGDKGEDK